MRAANTRAGAPTNAMDKFVDLSPAAQALLLHLKEIGAQSGEDILLSTLVAALSRQGFGIRETIAAATACVRGGWLTRSPITRTEPDRVALTHDGAGMLLFMP